MYLKAFGNSFWTIQGQRKMHGWLTKFFFLQSSIPFHSEPPNGLLETRGGNFRQKNNSEEDRRDGTNGYFRRNSDCSAEEKIHGIPFRTLPQKRKQLGIPFHGPKKEANSRNSLPNPSVEEKTTRNSDPCNENRSKLWEFCSEPFGNN